MPIRRCEKSGYKWGNSGKCYGSRQKAIKQMKAIFASGYEESINEGIKEGPPRKLSKVPGLKYIVHHVAGLKYFSLQHEGSKKYLIRSMHIEKILPVIDLANHYFSGYDFSKSHEDVAKNASHLYGVVKSFRQEVDRIHQPPKEKVKLKKKKKK